MTPTPLVIVGAGGFAREVLDVVEACNDRALHTGTAGGYQFLGFLDDGSPSIDLIKRRGATLLGGVESIRTLPTATRYVIGIGDSRVRQQLDERLSAWGYSPETLVHPTSTFGSLVDLGPGTVVCSHVSMTTEIVVGRHCLLNLNTTVGHDARLGDYVTVHPGATVSGSTEIGDGVLIGTNAAVLQGLKLHAWSTVGAGAVVTRDVDEGTVVAGVPAKPRGGT